MVLMVVKESETLKGGLSVQLSCTKQGELEMEDKACSKTTTGSVFTKAHTTIPPETSQSCDHNNRGSRGQANRSELYTPLCHSSPQYDCTNTNPLCHISSLKAQPIQLFQYLAVGN